MFFCQCDCTQVFDKIVGSVGVRGVLFRLYRWLDYFFGSLFIYFVYLHCFFHCSLPAFCFFDQSGPQYLQAENIDDKHGSSWGNHVKRTPYGFIHFQICLHLWYWGNWLSCKSVSANWTWFVTNIELMVLILAGATWMASFHLLLKVTMLLVNDNSLHKVTTSHITPHLPQFKTITITML